MRNYQLILAALMMVFVSCSGGSVSSNVQLETKVAAPERLEYQYDIIQELIEGNQRFINGTDYKSKQGMSYLEQFNGVEQRPLAVVIACTDMMVPSGLLFDQGMGDLVVVQSAGNSVMDEVTLGAVEMAFNRDGVNTIIVLSHTDCSIMGEFLQASPRHREGDQSIEAMVEWFDKEIPGYKSKYFNQDVCGNAEYASDLETVTDKNKDVQLWKLIMADNLKMAFCEGRVHLVSAHLDEATGVVKFDI